MIRPPAVLWLGLTGCLLAAPSTRADWEPVAPGIDYQSCVLPDPNNVFVARLDRSNPACIVDTAVGAGALVSGRETVSSMAAQHEDAIGYWGEIWGARSDVVVAVNGDFFNLTTGMPTGGQIASGWYVKRFPELGGGSGFAWQLDREVFIGECVGHVASKQKVAYPATGNSQNLSGVNTTRGDNQIILYTHHYDLTTGTDDSGVEVVVEMVRPTMILPTPSYASGYVREIRSGQGAAVIPFDCVVLSAVGNAAATLLNNVTLGAEVRISQEISHYEHDCSTSLPLDWTKTYAAIGGSFHFLKNGVLQSSSDPGATARHPRTAVAYNASYLFFIVVDGRSAASVGMSMTELGNFCLTSLAATDAINQDGGGSSAMWVDGEIVNVPSDGSERAVANGLMMSIVQPKETSNFLLADDQVRAKANTSLRVGPGINYASLASVSAGLTGAVLDHALGGVRASDDYWWKCQFAAGVGWMPQSALQKRGWGGDYNADGRVTDADLPQFVFCLRGPAITYVPGNFCLRGDADWDLDVDLADFAAFQFWFESP